MSVSHGIVAKLTSAAEFFWRRWFSQTVWRPYLQTGYAIFKITDFSYCLRFFAWVQNFLPIFHFTMLAGLHIYALKVEMPEVWRRAKVGVKRCR